MASAVHFWIAFFGTGLLLVVLAWAGSRRRKLGPKQLAGGNYPAACGSCGYDLTGLPGTTCPECGSDLELVGRLSPQFHRWAAVPVTARLIVWTVAVGAMGAGLVFIAMQSLLPQRVHFEVTGTWAIIQPKPQLPGENSLWTPVLVSVNGSFTRFMGANDALTTFTPSPSASTRWTAASLDLTTTSPPAVVELADGRRASVQERYGKALAHLEPDLSSNARLAALTRAGLAGAPASALSDGDDLKAALLYALNQAGYDGSQGSIDELVGALAPDIDAFLRYGAVVSQPGAGPWTPTHSQARTTHRSYEPFQLVGVSGFWLLVWALGLPFILRKRPISIRRERDEVPAELDPSAAAGRTREALMRAPVTESGAL